MIEFNGSYGICLIYYIFGLMLFRLFLLLIFPVFCFSQSQFRFEHFTIKNGLSQNTVHAALRDSEGYYWLGTQDGLNRYDGYSVKVYRHEKSDSTSISDNFILTIIEDRHKNLWIGTRNGFNHFDKRTEKFTRIISNEKERTNYHASVWSAFLDAEGDVCYTNHYHQMVRIAHEDSREPPFVPEIREDSIVLYKSSDKSYCLTDPTFKYIRSFSSGHEKKWDVSDISFGYIYAIVETPEGTSFIATGKGLYYKKSSATTLSPVKSLEGKQVNKLLYDSRKNLWAGTSSGLYVFPGTDLSAPPVLLTHSSEDIHSLGSSSVQELYEDAQGLIWAGTSEGGVSVYDPEKSVFKILNHSSSVPLAGNAVWGIYQEGRDLWVGTNNGLNHLLFENDTMSGLFSGKNRLIRSETHSTNQPGSGMQPSTVTAMCKDPDGNLWIATNHSGIVIYDLHTRSWSYFDPGNTPLKSSVIFHLMRASDGKIWISTLAGFYSYDTQKKSFQSFLGRGQPGGTFPSGYIINIFEDKDKTIWVGSTGGVYHLKSSGETIAIYKSEADKPNSLSYNMATGFHQDKKDRLWISTLGGGINLFDPKTETFRAYTQKDGLANDIIYCILEDKNGKLWISSNSGISCFDPEKEIFTNYTERDGLPANEFSQNAGFINNNGEILFGSPEGLVLFDPAAVKNSKREVPLVLSSLKVNYEPRSFLPGEPLQLFYGDKTVTFEFTAPDFRNQEKIQYAFRLEGFDDQWREVPASNRMASFTSLPFGNYSFTVRVRIGNGAWQEKQLIIPLQVIPPFWMRTWFIVLEVLIVLALIVYLVRFYAQRKLKQKLRAVEIQQKIHLEKERISRDLHDNVGAHLTYIITSLDNISYKMEKEEKSIPSDKISSLSDFSRSTMQQLRESIWAINKENITLEELKDKIGEYSGKMAAASNMNFHIELSTTSNNPLKPSHAINIYRVVQEAVNNSVKHSGAKALSVSISKNGGKYVSIEVKDNGKGMNPDANGNGYGLKNMQDRVKDLGGDILIDSNEKGTKVSFTIPI